MNSEKYFAIQIVADNSDMLEQHNLSFVNPTEERLKQIGICAALFSQDEPTLWMISISKSRATTRATKSTSISPLTYALVCRLTLLTAHHTARSTAQAICRPASQNMEKMPEQTNGITKATSISAASVHSKNM